MARNTNTRDNNAETSKRPSHRVFAVREGKDDNKFWTEIGAAWAHGDGKGFSIKCEAVPLQGRIIMRAYQPKPKAEGAGGH